MEEKEMYGLYVQVENSGSKVYPPYEGKNDDKKRGHLLMFHETMEGLDRLTSKFTSFQEINQAFKEIYNSDKNMYRPIIYVDKNIEDLSKSYYLTKVVYEDDFKELQNRDSIKEWLLDYLKSHPENIEHFGLLRNFYVNTKKTAPIKSVEYSLTIAVNRYLQQEGYIGYRESYFNLKEFDKTKEKKDEIHR